MNEYSDLCSNKEWRQFNNGIGGGVFGGNLMGPSSGGNSARKRERNI
jgi:hypothetical protein